MAQNIVRLPLAGHEGAILQIGDKDHGNDKLVSVYLMGGTTKVCTWKVAGSELILTDGHPKVAAEYQSAVEKMLRASGHLSS